MIVDDVRLRLDTAIAQLHNTADWLASVGYPAFAERLERSIAVLGRARQSTRELTEELQRCQRY